MPRNEVGTLRLSVRVSRRPSSPYKSTCTSLLAPTAIVIFNVIGETTLDICPGEVIRMADCLWPGIDVLVSVGARVNVAVGVSVFVGVTRADCAMKVSVAARFADSAVCAMIVGRTSGGIAVGIGFEAGAAHPANSPRRAANRRRRFM